jgi:hypothetical protein
MMKATTSIIDMLAKSHANGQRQDRVAVYSKAEPRHLTYIGDMHVSEIADVLTIDARWLREQLDLYDGRWCNSAFLIVRLLPGTILPVADTLITH